MEGPSIFLAVEQLSSFIGRKIIDVGGNTKLEKERMRNKKILSIFSFGKQLFFQFNTFALRVHFLLFGSFEATVNRVKVTGDYPTKKRVPRLTLELSNGHIELYSCSVLFVEDPDVRQSCDFSIDVMSEVWDPKKALAQVLEYQEYEIADVLLDQAIFGGVGNIIKNEVLLLSKISPLKKVNELSVAQLRRMIQIIRKFVFQFYQWRKAFVLRKHYKIYRQKICKVCGSEVIRQRTGIRKRISFICPLCEKS